MNQKVEALSSSVEKTQARTRGNEARIEEVDKKAQAALEANRRSKGVRREAARLLGIDPRNRAYYFRKHGLDPDAPAE